MKKVAGLVLAALIMSSTMVYADTTAKSLAQTNIVQSIDYTLSFTSTVSMPIEYNKTPQELKITRLTSQLVNKNSLIEFKIEGNTDIINAVSPNNFIAKINNKTVPISLEKTAESIKVSYQLKDLTESKLHWEFTFIDGDKYYSTGSYFLVTSGVEPIVKINSLSEVYPFETQSVKIDGLVASNDLDISSQCVFLKLKKNELINVEQIKNLIEDDSYFYIYLNDTTFGKSVPVNYTIPLRKLISKDTEPIEGSILVYTNDFLGYKGKKFELSPFKFTVEKPNLRLSLLERIKQTGANMKNATASLYQKAVSIIEKETESTLVQQPVAQETNITTETIFDRTTNQMNNKNTTSDTVINIIVSNKTVANSYANIDNFISIFSNEYRKELLNRPKSERIKTLESYIQNGNIEITLDSKIIQKQPSNIVTEESETFMSSDFERYLSYPIEFFKNATDTNIKKLLSAMELVQQNSEPEKAKSFLNDLLNKKFNETLCYRYMAEINIQEGNYTKAIENIRAGLKAYKTGDEYYISKGEFYLTIAYIYNLSGDYVRSNTNLDAAKGFKIGNLNGFPLAYENNKKHISKQ